MSTEKKKTVLCIGIAVLDIIATPIGAPDGWKEKQGISSITLLVGGDAANQSIHLSSLGYHAMMNGCVGGDSNGSLIRSSLQERGVDVSLVRTKKEIATGTALLLVDSRGERYIFSVRGAHSTLNRMDLPEEIPQDCAAISLESLFAMPEAEADGLEQFLQKAKKRGIPVFADMDSGRVVPMPPEQRALMPLIDYFIPSYYDVLPLTGKESLEEAAEYLLDLGVGNVIVKCGEKGCEVFGRTWRGSIPAIPVQPVDTTGAGDCMSAAFIARIAAGDDIETACRYACAAGSLCTLYPGANSIRLTDGEIREMMCRI